MVRKQFLLYLHFFTGSTDEVILLKPEKKVNNFIIEEITTVQDGRVKVTPTGYVRVPVIHIDIGTMLSNICGGNHLGFLIHKEKGRLSNDNLSTLY
jgi:hypothetical protein